MQSSLIKEHSAFLTNQAEVGTLLFTRKMRGVISTVTLWWAPFVIISVTSMQRASVVYIRLYQLSKYILRSFLTHVHRITDKQKHPFTGESDMTNLRLHFTTEALFAQFFSNVVRIMIGEDVDLMEYKWRLSEPVRCFHHRAQNVWKIGKENQ